MDKVKELKIDSTLWPAPSKLVNLLDFKQDKISIKTESNTKNNIKVHNIRYENGGFYLIIDNLEGYFDFSNNLGSLNMLFVDNDQQNKYYQVWKEILKIINGGHSMTIVVRSVVEKDNKFYPQILLNQCPYELKA